MDCCTHCEATEDIFGLKSAKKSIKKYRVKGPEKITGLLLEAIKRLGLSNSELLDIGAGIGVLHHELLGGSVNKVTHVDASQAHIQMAQEEDQLRDHAHPISYLHGDAVELADQLPVSDIVTLDKVLCCYPDWESLLQISANKTRDYYAISIPRDQWYVKLVMSFGNMVQKFKGSAFRVFNHSSELIEEKMATLNFTRVNHIETIAWQVRVYRKQELPQ